MEEALSITTDSLRILNQITERFPQQSTYSSLYRGYLHRDLYLMHLELGHQDQARLENGRAVRSKETFYLAYKTRYPQDAILIQHLAQEYYLALAEQLEYVETPVEKMMIRKTISGFLSKLEQDTGRQHVLLSELRARLT